VASKPETQKRIAEAREELKHADMGAFDRALRALVKITGPKKSKPRKMRGANGE
jgi:hypothetical protein